jgi:outer membrane protein OmpA-like peptidoglycan-associated protein
VRLKLATPPTVSVHVQDNVLHLSGHASKQWIEKVTPISLVAGVNRLEINELLETNQFLLAQAKQQLTPPDSVTLTVQERVLRVSGIVNPVTFKTLQQRIQNLSISPQAFADFDTNDLIDAEQERRKLIQLIEKTKIYFSDGAEFMPKQETTLQTLHKNVQQLLTLSQVLDQPARLQIIGNTDGPGSKIRNQQLSQERAQVVLSWLHRHGIEKNNLIIVPPPFIPFGESTPNPSDRNVSFQINVMGMDQTGITIRVSE